MPRRCACRSLVQAASIVDHLALDRLEHERPCAPAVGDSPGCVDDGTEPEGRTGSPVAIVWLRDSLVRSTIDEAGGLAVPGAGNDACAPRPTQGQPVSTRLPSVAAPDDTGKNGTLSGEKEGRAFSLIDGQRAVCHQ